MKIIHLLLRNCYKYGNDIRTNAAQILQYQLQKLENYYEYKSYGVASFLNTIVHPRNFEAVLLWSLALT